MKPTKAEINATIEECRRLAAFCYNCLVEVDTDHKQEAASAAMRQRNIQYHNRL